MELLAPAGNEECLHAAVQAGADAVYLGAGDFNARRGADNFTLETLEAGCDYAHLRGVKIYMTVNTVIMPDEFERALELVRQGYRRGVDAFIVQDIGLAREVSRVASDANLHISTQMNTHNSAGIAASAALGAKRVTLAREISLLEMRHLCDQAHDLGMQVEVFGHGALCICYSGQCYLSSLAGGRSANRGMCAQPCRLPYELHDSALRKPVDSDGDRLLSPKDLCTINLLGQLRDCGVDSVKIEGRMKSADYVSSVVGVYRKVLDRLGQDDEAHATREEERTLSEAFSRGFTTAYLTQDTKREMMSYKRPNNRGAFIGRISNVHGDVIDIESEQTISKGDALEFWTNRGHSAFVVGDVKEMGARTSTKSARDARGNRKSAKARRSDSVKDAKRVFRLEGVRLRLGKGDRVFRVRSASQSFKDNSLLPKVPVTASIKIHIGQPAQMTLTTASDRFTEPVSARVFGQPVERARTKALSASDVSDQIARMGSTPFDLKGIDVDLDDGVGMGFSQLHHLRAAASDELQNAILAPWHTRKLKRQEKRAIAASQPTRGCELTVLVSNPACARAARRAGADRILVHAENYGRGEGVIAGQLSQTAEQMGYPKKAIIDMPVVDHDPVEGTRESTFEFDPWRYVKDGRSVVVSNLGQLVRASEMNVELEVGPHIPADNLNTLQTLRDFGAKRVWLSPELSLDQVKKLGKDTPIPLGITVIGQAEVMTTEHCMLTSQGPCAQNCGSCPRRRSPHWLSDRKGYKVPVVTDLCGRSHLYNAVSLDIARMMPELLASGISAIMVDATLMTVQQTSEAVNRAKRARDLALTSNNSVSKREGTTTGHMFRPVE